MASPQIFISSTYYDLKHLRSALEAFITSLGYEPILSEKGEIAYSPDVPLDESCYQAAGRADVLVLIIGGRYGSAASDEEREPSPSFFERYDSITRKEYLAASEANIPTYILIERSVYAEYQTFRKNRDRTDINYAHVDSVNVFRLIDDILTQPRNNPVHQFERYQEVEEWLRAQWAGLFKDMLGRLTQQQRLVSLSSQVSQLAESNKTLRRYLEEVVSTVSPTKSQSLIDEESQRLDDTRIEAELASNSLLIFLSGGDSDMAGLRQLLERATSVADFMRSTVPPPPEGGGTMVEEFLLEDKDQLLEDVNAAREILNLPHLEFEVDPRGPTPAA